ncbi:MAG: type II toxin-antitoxin system RelE/ParE family toxin [Acidobacteria bacterium]|nr:type II toxin-antitoxin system RelE/ParE family toxin [Acidobacteriota bacterium]
MPLTQIVFFREASGGVPLLDWLDGLPDKARLKCLARLQRLETLGHELRRPEADYLRDDIYELRASFQGVHYRMLYFFFKTQAIVVSHGLKKEGEVPAAEINRAIARKIQFERAPDKHGFSGGS